VHDEPPHIVSDVAKADFDPGSVEADGPNLHPHTVFLVGEDMLDERANLGSRGVAAADVLRHRLAFRFLPMDVANQAVP